MCKQKRQENKEKKNSKTFFINTFSKVIQWNMCKFLINHSFLLSFVVCGNVLEGVWMLFTITICRLNIIRKKTLQILEQKKKKAHLHWATKCRMFSIQNHPKVGFNSTTKFFNNNVIKFHSFDFFFLLFYTNLKCHRGALIH